MNRRQVCVLSNFSGPLHGVAVSKEGALLAGSADGKVLVGSPSRWAAAVDVGNGTDGVVGIVSAQDGYFLTSHRSGTVKLWRDNKVHLSVLGAFGSAYCGNPIAIVGDRLVAAGQTEPMLVFEGTG